MAQDPGQFDLDAAIAAAVAATGTGGQSQAALPFIPLWKARPKARTITVNPGQFGDGEDLRSPGGGRVTGGRGRLTVGPSDSEFYTKDQASSAYLDLDDKDRADFRKRAIDAGLIRPGADGVSDTEVFEAWQRAANYAAMYNSDREKDKWISPWEAVHRLAVQGVAGAGGAYDPFRPRTQTSTTKRNFTKGSDAEAVTRSLESIFNEEMGRAPTQEERAIYQRLVQKAYDKNPERTTTVTQTGEDGNTTSTSTAAGGVDMTATLLDQVRDTDEADAYQAGATFFEAAMQALGAIA